MVRVFIDPHMFSLPWFQVALADLVLSKKVMFLFSNCEKGLGELQKVRQAFAFKKAMAAARKAVEAPVDEVAKHVAFLETHPAFVRCGECDDPHIMAAIFIHPTKYVFTGDHRLARCRDNLSGIINRRYLAFSIVSDERGFAELRHRLV